jgi:hypothetical protein
MIPAASAEVGEINTRFTNLSASNRPVVAMRVSQMGLPRTPTGGSIASKNYWSRRVVVRTIERHLSLLLKGEYA